jgi:Leu/Phe-tRNA-protein transferase
MEKKINVTPKEYSELQKLAQISNNKLMSIGQRKIAKAQYEAILRLAKYRPHTPSPLKDMY